MKTKILTFVFIAGIFWSCNKETNEPQNSEAILSVSTISVTEITQTTATSGGSIENTSNIQILSKGVCWSESEMPTVSDNSTSDGSGSDNYSSNLIDLSANTTYYVRTYLITEDSTIYGNQVTFTTNSNQSTNINYGTVSDYEGNSYKTIIIGTQTWMAENLRSEKYNDGTAISLITDSLEWYSTSDAGYCYYNNNSVFKSTYGALYNNAAVQSGKLCPTGWHIPTKAEWQTLLDYLSNNGNNYDGTTVSNKVAIAMSEYNGWTYTTGMGCVGNNDYETFHNRSGFSAKPAGYRLPMNLGISSYLYSTSQTNWWASDMANSEMGNAVKIDNLYPDVKVTSLMIHAGASIRCVKD